jgi:PAS domain-containing protein
MWQLIVGVLLGAVATVVVLRRTTRPSAPEVVEDSSPKEDVVNSNESLEALVDALPMGIVVVGKDGQVRFRNNAMSTVTGTRHVDVLVEAATERLIDRALLPLGQFQCWQKLWKARQRTNSSCDLLGEWC